MSIVCLKTFVLALLASRTCALTTEPHIEDCEKACPKTLVWVCGSDGNSYTNLCALEVASCMNEDVKYAHDGMCTNPRLFDMASHCAKCKSGGEPVCGTDGLTYANDCALEAIACAEADNGLKVKHIGACTSEERLDCPPSKCESGAPVCATDGIITLTGRAFDSPCTLQAYICATGKGLMATSDPSCLIPIEPPAPAGACDIACQASYEPVCGTDGQTYSSACMLKLSACQSGSSTLSVASEGECPEEKSHSGGWVMYVIGAAIGLGALLAILVVGYFVLRRRALRRRRFRVMESYEDELEDSDSERSLDVQDMHMKASQTALNSSFSDIPRKESL